jgi:hypothetical protein
VLLWEILAGGLGLSLLYLVISPKGSKVTTGVLGGVTGALDRLASPEGLWSKAPSPVAGVSGTATAAGKPAGGVSGSTGTTTKVPARTLQTVLGPKLPSFATVTPTIPGG